MLSHKNDVIQTEYKHETTNFNMAAS